MKNTPSWADIEFLDDVDLDELHLDQIGVAYGEANKAAQAAVAAKKKLTDHLLKRRFADELQSMTTGTTTIARGDTEVKVTIPKTVTWDQNKLGQISSLIRTQWGDDPDEYMTIQYKVSETAYKGWPGKLQDVFIDARSVKPGSPKIEFRDTQNRGTE